MQETRVDAVTQPHRVNRHSHRHLGAEPFRRVLPLSVRHEDDVLVAIVAERGPQDREGCGQARVETGAAAAAHRVDGPSDLPAGVRSRQ